MCNVLCRPLQCANCIFQSPFLICHVQSAMQCANCIFGIPVAPLQCAMCSTDRFDVQCASPVWSKCSLLNVYVTQGIQVLQCNFKRAFSNIKAPLLPVETFNHLLCKALCGGASVHLLSVWTPCLALSSFYTASKPWSLLM